MEDSGADGPTYPLSQTGNDESLVPLNSADVTGDDESGAQESSGPYSGLASGPFAPPPFQLSAQQQAAIKAALDTLEATFTEERQQGVPESVLEAQRQALQKRMMAEYAEAYRKSQVAAYQAAREQQQTALSESQKDLAAANASKAAAYSLVTQAQAAAGVAASNRQLMITKQQELGQLQKTLENLTAQRDTAEATKKDAEAAREAAIQTAAQRQQALAQAEQLNQRLLEDVEDYTEARDALEAATAAYDTALEEKEAAVAAATEARSVYAAKQTARAAAATRVTQLEAEILTLNGLVKTAEEAGAAAKAAADALAAKDQALTAATEAAGTAEAARAAAAARVEDLTADEGLLAQLNTEKTALQEALSRADAELMTSSQIVADAQAELTRLSGLQTGAATDRARLDTELETLAGITGQIEQLRTALRAKRMEAEEAICDANAAAATAADATTARNAAAARLTQFTGLRDSIMTLLGQIESLKSQIAAARLLVQQREAELAAAAPLYPDAVQIQGQLNSAAPGFRTAYQTFTTANDRYLTVKSSADRQRTNINNLFETIQTVQNLFHLSEDYVLFTDIYNSTRTVLSNCITRYLSNAIHPNFISRALGFGTNNTTSLVVPALAIVDSGISAFTTLINDTSAGFPNGGTLAGPYFSNILQQKYTDISLNQMIDFFVTGGMLTRSANSMPHTWVRRTLTIAGDPNAVMYNTPWPGGGSLQMITIPERYLELPRVVEALQQIRPAVERFWNLTSQAGQNINATRTQLGTMARDTIMARGYGTIAGITATTDPFNQVINLFGTMTSLGNPTYPVRYTDNPLIPNNPVRLGALLSNLNSTITGTTFTSTFTAETTSLQTRETSVTSVQSAGGTVYPLLNSISDKFNVYITNTQTAPVSVAKTVTPPPDWVTTQGQVVPPPTTQQRVVLPASNDLKGLPLFSAPTDTLLGINYSTWDLGFTPSPVQSDCIEFHTDANRRTLSCYIRQLRKLRDYFFRIGLRFSPTFDGSPGIAPPPAAFRTELWNRVQQEITRLRGLPPPPVDDLWDRRIGQLGPVVPSGAGQAGSIQLVPDGQSGGTLAWMPPNTEATWKNVRRMISKQRFHPPAFITFRVASFVSGECHIGFSTNSTTTLINAYSDCDYYLQIKPDRHMVRNQSVAGVAETIASVVGSTYTILWLPTNHIMCFINGALIGGDPGGIVRPSSTLLNNNDFYYNSSYKQVFISGTLNGVGPVLTDFYFGTIPGYTMNEFDRLDRGLATLDRINRRLRDDNILQMTDSTNNMHLYATAPAGYPFSLEAAIYYFVENATRHYRSVRRDATYRTIMQAAWTYCRSLVTGTNSIRTENTTLQTNIVNGINTDSDQQYRAFFKLTNTYSTGNTYIGNPRTFRNLRYLTPSITNVAITDFTTASNQTRLTDLSNNINGFIADRVLIQNVKSAYKILKAGIPGFIAEQGRSYTISATDTSLQAAAATFTTAVGASYNASTRVLSFTNNLILSGTTRIPKFLNVSNYEVNINGIWNGYDARTTPLYKTTTDNSQWWTYNAWIVFNTATLTERFELLENIYIKVNEIQKALIRIDANLARLSTIDSTIFNLVRLPHLVRDYTTPAAPNSFYEYLASISPTGYATPSASAPTIANLIDAINVKNFNTDANGYIAQNFTNILTTTRNAVKNPNFRADREALLVFATLVREQVNEIILDMNTYFGNYIQINGQLNMTLPYYLPPSVSTVPFTAYTVDNALTYINGLIQQFLAARATAQTNLDTANATLTQRLNSLTTQNQQLQSLIGQVQSLYTAATGAYTFSGPESGPQFANNLNLPAIFQQLSNTSAQATTLLNQATAANTEKQAAASTQIQAYRSLRSQLIAQLQAKDLKLRTLLDDFSKYAASVSLAVKRTPAASGPFAEAAAVQESGAVQAGGALLPALSLQTVQSAASGPVCSSGPNALEPEVTMNYSSFEQQLSTINTNLSNYLNRLVAGIQDLTNDLRLWNKIKRVQTAKKTTAEAAYSAKAAAASAQQKLIADTYTPSPAAVRQDLTTKTTAATAAAQAQTTAQGQRDSALQTKTQKDEASANASSARNAKLASVYQTFSSALTAAAGGSGATEAPTLNTITQIHDAALATRETAIAEQETARTEKEAAEKVESSAITVANSTQSDKTQAQETYMTNLRELYLQYGPNVTRSVTGLQELPDLQLPSGATLAPGIEGLQILEQASGASGSFGAFMLNTYLQRSQAYEQAVAQRTQANEVYTTATTSLTNAQAAASQASQAVSEKTEDIATTFNNQSLEQLTSIEQTAKAFAEEKVQGYQTATAAVQQLEDEVQQITQQVQQSEIAVTTATQLRVAAQAEVAAAETAEEDAEEAVQETYVARVEESRAVAETKRLEESRAVAETIRLEESRAVAETKRLEESRAVAEVKRIEESRAAAESKAEVERLEASRAVAEVNRLNRESMAIATMIEDNRIAEESRAVAAATAQAARRQQLQTHLQSILSSTTVPSGATEVEAALQSGAVQISTLSAIADTIEAASIQVAAIQKSFTEAVITLEQARGEVIQISAELKLVQAAILEAIRVNAPPESIQQLQAREQQLLSSLSEAQATVDIAESAVATLQQQAQEITAALKEAQEQQVEAEQAFRERTLQTIETRQLQLKTITESIASTQATIKDLTASKADTQKELTEVEQQLATATGPQRQMLLATQVRLQTELAEIQESIDVATASLTKLQASATQLQQEIKTLEESLQSATTLRQETIATLQLQSGAVAAELQQRAVQIQAVQTQIASGAQLVETTVKSLVESTGITKAAESIREQQAAAQQQLALAMNAAADAASQANILQSGANQLSAVTEISTQIEGVYTQLSTLQESLTKAMVQQAQAIGEVNRIQVELESLRAAILEAIRINAPAALISQLQAREKELVNEVEEAQKRVASVQTSVATIQEQIKTLTATLTSLQVQQAAVENTARTSIQQTIELREQQLSTITASIQTTQSSITSLNSRIQSLEKELATVQQQIVNATGSQRQLLLAKQETLQQELTTARISLTTATTALARLQQSSTAVTTEIKTLQQQIQALTTTRAAIQSAQEKQISAMKVQDSQRAEQLITIQTMIKVQAAEAEKKIVALVRDSGITEAAIHQTAQKKIEELQRQKQQLLSTALMQRAEQRKVRVTAAPLQRGEIPVDDLHLSFRSALNSIRTKLKPKPVTNLVPAANSQNNTTPIANNSGEQPTYGYGYGPRYGYGNRGSQNAAVEGTVVQEGGGNLNAIFERMQAHVKTLRQPENPVVTTNEQGAVEQGAVEEANVQPSYGDPQQGGRKTRKRKITV